MAEKRGKLKKFQYISGSPTSPVNHCNDLLQALYLLLLLLYQLRQLCALSLQDGHAVLVVR